MRLLFLLSLGCALALPVYAGQPPAPLQGSITWVYDGDTLKVDPVGKVRLIGIDTPERKNSPRDHFLQERGVPAARQRQVARLAKDLVIALAKGQKVTLELDATARDRHGRLLAYVFLPDGRLLNRLLLEQGLAVVYRRFSFRMKTDFLTVEAKAKQDKLGLWTEALP